MQGVFLIAACASVLAVALICIFLFANGAPAMKEIGFGRFLSGVIWRPNNDIYGILPMIVGSLYVTAGAIIVGVPIGILTAVFMALGIAATCFSGCGLTEGEWRNICFGTDQGGGHSSTKTYEKQLRRQAQGLSPAIQETHLQKRKKKLHNIKRSFNRFR